MEKEQASKADPAATTKAVSIAGPLHELATWSDASVDELVVAGTLERHTREQGQAYLGHCRRVLRPDGVLRIASANLSTLVNDYSKGKLDRVPRDLWAPESRAQLLNEGMRNWGHQFLYDPAELEAALAEAGFRKVAKGKPGAKLGVEIADFGQLMIYEAKP